MVRDPPHLHGLRRLDDDREKQVKLPDNRPSLDVHPHPYSARLTVAAPVKDLDLTDDVGAPLRVLAAVDAGTRVDVRATTFPRASPAEDHAAGLASSLANLAAHLER